MNLQNVVLGQQQQQLGCCHVGDVHPDLAFGMQHQHHSEIQPNRCNVSIETTKPFGVIVIQQF